MSDTTYIRQIKVNTTRDGKTVSGHVILTQGIWHGMVPDSNGNTDAHFCLLSTKAPQGLPIIDQTTPFGSLMIPPLF